MTGRMGDSQNPNLLDVGRANSVLSGETSPNPGIPVSQFPGPGRADRPRCSSVRATPTTLGLELQ